MLVLTLEWEGVSGLLLMEEMQEVLIVIFGVVLLGLVLHCIIKDISHSPAQVLLTKNSRSQHTFRS